MPVRIQRKRTAGWRKPEGAVNVDRNTEWGNPFKQGETPDPDYLGILGIESEYINPYIVKDNEHAVRLFRDLTDKLPDFRKRAKEALQGKTLMCWCNEDQPCHADVLLEIANN